MASQRISREIIEGIEAAALECPLCMDRFTNPKLLPCIHSFCLGCLEKWVKERNGELSCPTCREVCQIPTSGLKKLQNNIFITGLLDYVTKLEQKSVPACGCKKDALFCCRDCDELYCRDCRHAHRIMKISKDHSIITLKEYNTVDPLERFASKSLNCSEHNMPLHFFCDSDSDPKSCKKPVCVGCTQVQHKGDAHNILDVKNAFEAFSTQASELIKASDIKLLDFRRMVEELKEKKGVVNKNYSKCKTDITRQADELHRLIDWHKEDQLQNLESSHNQKLKLLEAQVSDVELAIAKLNSMRGITHNLANSPNQVMALMSSYRATTQLDKLLKNEVSKEPEELGILEYNSDGALSKLLADKVVERLLWNETHISPKQSTIDVLQHGSQPKLFNLALGRKPRLNTGISITTRNTLGGITYFMDAKVKCLGINNGRIIMEEISVIDEHNGCYQISCDIPFNNCTLICMIIDRSGAYVNIIDFDKHGNCSELERHFQPFAN